MSQSKLLIRGVSVPRFLYGTAWKEEQTRSLTELALQQGFRGIDTANQRWHYYEAGVGEAIAASAEKELLTRNQLFLQTKFTFHQAQDHRLPYDPKAPVSVQVEQSFASSLRHLGTDWIDSYVLHGPSRQVGLGPDDWAAWQAMEAIHDSGRVRFLGVSNVSLEQLKLLCEKAAVAPTFVQNRCYSRRGWDRPIREFCSANDLVYQGFSLLTANRSELSRPELVRIAEQYGRTPSQIVFRFALDVGMIALTGTTSAEHMQQDLDVFGFELQPDEVRAIQELATNAA